MELKEYLTVIWKWLWLIVLATGVAAVSSYLASRSAVPIYKTSTTLMVGQTMQNPNPGGYDLYTSQYLARTYADMATREPVLQATVDSLKLPIPWTALKAQTVASVVAETQLIEIRVVDTNPRRAKALADEIARQLILQSPTPSGKQQDAQRQFVTSQLDDLRTRIQQTKSDMQDLQAAMADEVSARRIQDIQSEIATKQNQLNVWQTNYVNLLTYTEGGSNYLSVVEPASLPTNPINAGSGTNMMLAASIGLILAVGAAFLMEYLDDTIKSPDDVQRVLKTSALGMITRITPVDQPPDALVTALYPEGSTSEAYRVLRTNIEFAALDEGSSTLLITSSGPQEGKTTTLANLGVAIAQQGRRTLLVDGDLRRPTLHKVFGLSNKRGVTTLLLAANPDIMTAAQATKVTGLYVLTAGPQPPNPAELLASKRMDGIINLAGKSFDVALFDGPPVLAVADASILAAKLHQYILIVDAGRTRSELAQRAKQTLDNSGAKLLGVVLNRLATHRGGRGYYYYYEYYSSVDGVRKRRKQQKGLRGWLRRLRRPLPEASSHGKRNNHDGAVKEDALALVETEGAVIESPH